MEFELYRGEPCRVAFPDEVLMPVDFPYIPMDIGLEKDKRTLLMTDCVDHIRDCEMNKQQVSELARQFQKLADAMEN